MRPRITAGCAARVAAWGDPRYITRLTEDYVDRLLTLKRNGEALDVVAARLADDATFRPKSAAATLQIARDRRRRRRQQARRASPARRFFDAICRATRVSPAAAALAQQLDA